jgi:O-6-methylguanine DNA methyltransferase
MKKTFTRQGSVREMDIPTADGIFTAHYSETGLAGLDFPARRKPTRVAAPEKIPANVIAWHRTTEAALKNILAGKTPKKFPPFDLSDGTEFQQSVWRELQKISAGKTKSYGELAGLLRKPKAVRAVGGACGANPIPVLIPCHRVLAANGKLGGFSGGLDWKRKLLARENMSYQ